MDNNLNFLYIVDATAQQLVFRSFELSKRLVKKKIYPIILTQKFRNENSLSKSIIEKMRSFLKVYRASFFRINNKYLSFLLKKIFELDFYFRWIPFAFLQAKKILKEHKINFVYVSGPPFDNHFVGFFLKKKYNVPLIIEYRDPWSYNPYTNNNQQWFRKKIDQIFERKILKITDSIITVSSALTQFLIRNFPFIKDKLIISIPNGLNLLNLKELPNKNSRKITFTFVGSLYGKRSIIPLLMIISKLKNENLFQDIDFLIKVFGNYNKKKLELAVKKLKIDNLIYLGGYIPRSKSFQELIKSDIAIHIGENLNYPTIAFKVWDYLCCKKKILYLGRSDSYTAKFLEDNNLGLVIPINKLEKGKEKLKETIMNLRMGKFSNKIDDKLLENFTWEKRAEKFKKIINLIKQRYRN